MRSENDFVAVLPTESSPAVNVMLLREVAAVNARLEAFGLQPSSGYNLAPALGGGVEKASPAAGARSANVAFQTIFPLATE